MVVWIQVALQKETSIDRITPERFLKIVRKLSPFKSDEDMLELSTVLVTLPASYLSIIYLCIYQSIYNLSMYLSIYHIYAAIIDHIHIVSI